jgi:hypothetical protein
MVNANYSQLYINDNNSQWRLCILFTFYEGERIPLIAHQPMTNRENQVKYRPCESNTGELA